MKKSYNSNPLKSRLIPMDAFSEPGVTGFDLSGSALVSGMFSVV